MAVVRDRAPSITVISAPLLLTLIILTYLLITPNYLVLHLLVPIRIVPDPRHLFLPLNESPITLARLVLSILDELLTQNVRLSSPDPFCQGVWAGWAISATYTRFRSTSIASRYSSVGLFISVFPGSVTFAVHSFILSST
ncbi:hypothetical protein PROFUN_16719, partial [Planoprotostelium fungivorum]